MDNLHFTEKLTEKKSNNLFKKLITKQESSIVIFLILFITIVTIVNPVFLTSKNLLNILRSTGFTMMSVVGMTFVLITAGLDLSIGSVFAIGSIVTGTMLAAGIPIALCITIGLTAGLAVGLINAVVIVKAGVSPIIATLAMLYMGRGFVSILTKGAPIYPLPQDFVSIEKVKIFGEIPIIIIISVIVAVIAHLILTKTVYGRSVYAVGGNEEAAKICGINIAKIKASVYIIVAVLAAFSGIMMASRLGSAEPASGSGFELKVICGAIIGGVSTYGGLGSIIGAALGALFMDVMTNSLTLMKIDVYWQNLVFGAILLASVLLDQYKRKMILSQAIK